MSQRCEAKDVQFKTIHRLTNLSREQQIEINPISILISSIQIVRSYTNQLTPLGNRNLKEQMLQS